MNIIVNGERITLSEFDDSKSLRNYLCLKNPGTLPSYFRIVPSGDKFVSTSFLEDISSLSYSDLKRPGVMLELKSKYPFVFYPNAGEGENLRLFSGAWLNVHGYDSRFASLMKEIDYSSFSSMSRIDYITRDYVSHVTDVRRQIEQKTKSFGVAKKDLLKESAVDISKITIEEKTVSLSLDISSHTNLIEIFDSFIPSKWVPFISYNHHNTHYYKIYSGFTIPEDSWFEDTENVRNNDSYLKIYVFSLPKQYESNRQYQESNRYTPVYWYQGNILETTFFVKQDFTINDLWVRLIEATEKLVINNQYYSERSITAKVDFDFEIERATFADFILFDPLASYFFLADESIMTTAQKKRMYFFFDREVSVLQKNQAYRMTATQQETFRIGISNAENEMQVRAISNIITRLLGRYSHQKKAIIRKYEAIFQESIPPPPEKFTKREDRKTGKKLKDLRRLFGEDVVSKNDYSKSCAKERQPTIIDEEEANEIKKIHPGLVYELQGHYMKCLDPTRPYPGPTKGGFPCCFAKPRQTEGNILVANQKKPAVYIMGPEKQVEENRKGELRLLYQRILYFLGVEKSSIKKPTDVYPYLRRGFKQTSYSFLSCLGYAFGKSETQLLQKAAEFIRKPGVFPACKQEMYDYTLEWVVSELLSYEPNIHPAIYVRLFEIMLNINILMFVTTEKGEDIYEPRHASKYILRPFDIKKPVVVIFVVPESKDIYKSVQCELLVFSDESLFYVGKDVFVTYLASLVPVSRKLWQINNDTLLAQEIDKREGLF